ncbi:MAG: CHAD domain-containing protein [Planctomycetota bacterium]
MAASDNSIADDDSRMAVCRLAATTLRNRFDLVWTELQAACAAENVPEHVHKLRIATRRALAAIDAFHDVLPAKRRNWFEKRLIRLRRAAGEARDLDVLTARLAQDDMARARSWLVAMLSRQRIQSRQPIHSQFEKLVEENWGDRLTRLLEDLHGRQRKRCFRSFARHRFKPMIMRFFENADRSLRDTDELHEVRIKGKKLRYALEIFAPAFPLVARMRCQKSLEHFQKALGECTDHASAADRFARWARSADAGPNRDLLAALCADENKRAHSARKTFSKWWNPARRRTLRRRFERTLRRHTA